jgi:hypothetical protein
MFEPQRTIQLVKGALLDPEPTWRGYLAEAGDWKKTAVLLTGPLIVASALIAYVLSFSGGGPFGIRPTLTSTVLSMVSGAVAIAVVSFILSGLSQAFGGKGGFALGLAAATLAFVPGYVGQALAYLPWIGGLLALGLGIYGLVLLWRIIPIYLQLPSNKRVVHYILSIVASIVAMIVISTILGGSMMGAGMRPGMGGGMGAMGPSSTTTTASGPFGNIARQGELIAMAEEDRYEPPRNGRVTEDQVQEFIRVMQRTSEAVAERSARVQELAEQAENDEEVSFSDFGAMMSGMTEVMGLNTAEIEIVKTSGGDWAEHQWVKETLRTAWLQQDINDVVTANYALFQEYENALAEFVTQ